MSRKLLSLGALMLVLAGHLAAQGQSTEFVPGRLMRVEIGGSGKVEGSLAFLGPDTLGLVRENSDTVRVLRSSITKLELYQGKQHNVGRAALMGSAIGGGVGLMLGVLTAAAQNEDEFLYVPPGQLVLGGTLGGALWGAAIGTFVGLVSKSPKWTRVPLPSVTVSPGGTDGAGVAVGFNIRF